MRLILLSLCLVFASQPLWAGQKRVTLYLDGARVEQEATAQQGYLELRLPESLQPGSLRVKPVGGSVRRVEVVPADADRRDRAKIAQLEKRKAELQDRMQLLSSREEIFGAAVKAQSSRAARKSKSNPDPLQSLRQGTEFALGELEQVQRSKVRCQRELQMVERELAAVPKKGVVARVWLSGTRARISYLRNGECWTPSYDFRLSGAGEGELVLHAKLPLREKGAQYLISPGSLAAAAEPRPVRGEFPVISRHQLTLEKVSFSDSPYPSLSFGFTHPASLPPGEAAGYWRGEYVGASRHPGGGSGQISFGVR